MPSSFLVRRGSVEDLPAMLHVERATWGGLADDYAYSMAQIEDAVAAFPEGQIVVVEEGSGQIVAMANTIRNHFDPNRLKSWVEVSGNGWAGKVHEPDGPSLYGINLACLPDHKGTGASRLAIEGQMRLVLEIGAKNLYAGLRMPGYHTWCSVFKPEDYIRLRSVHGNVYFVSEDGEVYDLGPEEAVEPKIETVNVYDGRKISDSAEQSHARSAEPLDHGLRAFMRMRINDQGFRLVKVIPEYFEDPESLNYGVLVIWEPPQGRE